MSEDLGEIVSLLNLGITQSTLYFRGHPRLGETVQDLLAKLSARAPRGATEGLFLGVVGGKLVHGGKTLLGPTLIAKRLIEAARRLRCGGFLFQPTLTGDDLKEWFTACAEAKRGVASLEEARRLLAARGVKGIALSPPYGEPGWLGDAVIVPGVGAISANDVAEAVQAAVPTETPESAVPTYHALLETVETAHANVETDRPPDVNVARTQAEILVRVAESKPSDLLHLARYPHYSSYTTGHSVRVTLLVALVAHHLRFPGELVVELATAALLHDVGKGKVPMEILYKNGPLEAWEREIITRHTTFGRDALVQTPEASSLAINAAASHHIRFDRRGYPAIDAYHEPTRLTYLLQVCDVFEALTAVRPYKPSLTPQRAYEIMLKDSAAFDPVAFRAFVAAVGLYPPGSRVRLSSGEEAFVLSAGRHIARPRVEITHDASGRALSPGDRPAVDLDADPLGRGVQQLIPEQEDRVEARPADYEERPTTVVLRGCGHDRVGDSCALCA